MDSRALAAGVAVCLVVTCTLAAGCGGSVGIIAAHEDGSGAGDAEDGTGGDGAGAGGGGGGAGCDAPCAAEEACVEGVCTPFDLLLFQAIHQHMVHADGAEDHRSTTSACVLTLDPTAPGTQTLAEDGLCRVIEILGPTYAETAPDAGALTLATPSLGVLSLKLDAGAPCPQLFLGNAPAFTAGEIVTFAADGGAHFPAFRMGLAFPETFEVGGGTLVRGEPYAVTWTGDVPPLVMVTVSGGSRQVICHPDQGNAWTVPASLTGLLDGMSAPGVVFALVRRTADLEVSPLVRVRADAVETQVLGVDYVP